MEQTPKTSFIPKQVAGSTMKRQHRTLNVLSFFATVCFLAVLGLSIGVFFYHEYSKEQLEARKVELAELKKSFSETDIATIKDFEKRLNGATALLDNHISLSRVFDALEASTQQNAQIARFEYQRLPSGNAELILSGLAQTFNTVALQERAYSNETAFRKGSIVFDNLNIANGEQGQTVTFGVVADLDTTAVAYVAKQEGDPTVEIANELATTTNGVIPEVQGVATSTEFDKNPLISEISPE